MLHAAILPIPVPFENASRSGAGIACLFTTKTRVSTSSPRKKLVVFRISPQWSQGRTWIGQLGSSEMSEETAETARDSALSLSLSLFVDSTYLSTRSKSTISRAPSRDGGPQMHPNAPLSLESLVPLEGLVDEATSIAPRSHFGRSLAEVRLHVARCTVQRVAFLLWELNAKCSAKCLSLPPTGSQGPQEQTCQKKFSSCSSPPVSHGWRPG